ncbi:hypothetical protein ABZ756_06835 [Mammaliicoccus sciuri]|uniref:Short-chain dehydrogenase n=2 Tax=Sporosarcina newyorkensis TaxID=759851 RepID=A0A1T4YGA9_9BACL|nr:MULTISPECIES: hypothetical protein [Sporosarcina]EGQ27120.1 hypothetical protein HMPREF9372_0807 [Sporosarcina newyorkensis 2681]MBY0222978.1 hypothetical protein [Sporosarcina aquimarina]SKB00700.1 hypothetical protein SAMN04244570_2559 [Sporosarcina newyorkensis]
MWDIWLWPMIFVSAIMLWICLAAVRKSSRSLQLNEKDQIPETVAEHPYTINPILWIILIATFFALFVIFYYWASS